MATVLKIGPADHGRPMALQEFLAGDYEEGYHYELIDGRLYVAPEANLPEHLNELWVFKKLLAYAECHPQVINMVTNKARVFVPGRPGITAPEPDLAAYRHFPLGRPFEQLRWQDYRPLLVGEVLSAEDPDKDLVRNVDLYLQVPSIKEYWVLDTRENPNRPTMRVHRRSRKQWRIIDLAAGDVYTTRLLPGFRLVLDPRG